MGISYKLSAAIFLSFLLGGIGVWRFAEGNRDALIFLKNGPFRAAYLVADADAERVDITIVVQTGEADATGPEGLAHYVEHLSWLNANKEAGPDAARHSNAQTTSMATSYEATVALGSLDTGLTRLTKIWSPLTIDPEFMKEERGIVLREYDLSTRNDSFAPIWDGMFRSLYGGYPLSRSVIGTPQSIAAFTVEDAAALRSKTHLTANMVLIIKGDLSGSDAQSAISALGLPDAVSTPPAAISIAPEEPLNDISAVSTPGTVPVQMLELRLATSNDCGTSAACNAGLVLLNDLLISSLPGGLAKPLRFDAFISQGFDVWVSHPDRTHTLMSFSSRPDQDVALPALSSAFDDAMAYLALNGIPEDTFQKIKDRVIADWSRIDDVPGTIYRNTIASVRNREEPYDLQDNIAAVKAYTLADLDRMIRALANPDRKVIRYVKPAEQER